MDGNVDSTVVLSNKYPISDTKQVVMIFLI